MSFRALVLPAVLACGPAARPPTDRSPPSGRWPTAASSTGSNIARRDQRPEPTAEERARAQQDAETMMRDERSGAPTCRAPAAPRPVSERPERRGSLFGGVARCGGSTHDRRPPVADRRRRRGALPPHAPRATAGPAEPRAPAPAAEALFARLYQELRRLARSRLASGGRHTLLDTSAWCTRPSCACSATAWSR